MADLIVLSCDVPGLKEYFLKTLAKGGCNTFPDRMVHCTCGTTVYANHEKSNCPACKAPLVIPHGLNFSNWASGTQ